MICPEWFREGDKFRMGTEQGAVQKWVHLLIGGLVVLGIWFSSMFSGRICNTNSSLFVWFNTCTAIREIIVRFNTFTSILEIIISFPLVCGMFHGVRGWVGGVVMCYRALVVKIMDHLGVFVFQVGFQSLNLSFGLSPLGSLESFIIILLLCVAMVTRLGISYEYFTRRSRTVQTLVTARARAVR
uniref:Uncharacterized protein n=2 Tax=Cacopsylla melanoneura TaxID=428564 RepID=A0A8D8QB34_9HEMI